jgi:outer membrane protein TolC
MAARAALAHRSRQVLNEASEEPEATPPEVLELQNEVRDLRRELADLRVRARIAEARYEVGERLIEAQRVAAHDAETLIEALTITTRNAEAGYEAAERVIDRIVPNYNRAMARLDELEPDLDSDSDSGVSSLIGSDHGGGA